MSRFSGAMVWPLVLCVAFSGPPFAPRIHRVEPVGRQSQARRPIAPLMLAAKKGDLKSVLRLLKAGAAVNDQDENGFTALHYSVPCGSIRIVKALLSAGADVNARTNEGVTPLQMSVTMDCGRPEIALTLIDAGADVSATADGYSALEIATTESSIDVMKALLEKGADPNVQDKHGDTPLHMAAMNGFADRVELLLHYDAKPTIRNAGGKTPLDVAKSPEVRKLLRKYPEK